MQIFQSCFITGNKHGLCRNELSTHVFLSYSLAKMVLQHNQLLNAHFTMIIKLRLRPSDRSVASALIVSFLQNWIFHSKTTQLQTVTKRQRNDIFLKILPTTRSQLRIVSWTTLPWKVLAYGMKHSRVILRIRSVLNFRLNKLLTQKHLSIQQPIFTRRNVFLVL